MNSFSINWDTAGPRIEVKQLSNIKEDDVYQKKETLELSRALQEYTHRSTDSKSIFWSQLESVVSSEEEKQIEERQKREEKVKYNFLQKIQRKIKQLKEQRQSKLTIPKTTSEQRFLKFKKINSKLEKPPIYLPIRKLIQKPSEEKLKDYSSTDRLAVPSVPVWGGLSTYSHSKLQSYCSNRSTRFDTDIQSGNLSKTSKDGPILYSRPHSQTKLAQAIYMDTKANKRIPEYESTRLFSQTSKLQLTNMKRGHSSQLTRQGLSQRKNRNYNSASGLLERYLPYSKEGSTNASIQQLDFFKQPEGYVSCGGVRKQDTEAKSRRKMKSVGIFDVVHRRQAMDTMDAHPAFF